MVNLKITLEEGESKGRYAVQPDPSGPMAELTFSKAGTSLLIIDHTDIPDAFRGKGLGEKLVERAVEDARQKGKKIVPLCPFAASRFRQHPDWADVLNR